MSEKYLLDTNVLIRATQNDNHLASAHRAIIDARRDLVVSIVTFWEVAIKQSLGKLHLDGDLAEVVRQRAIPILPVTLAHIERIRSLPFHHRDPFDRMLIAQAQVDQLTILTADRHFPSYDVKLA
jgi:PIN domain nuclease of toxin-antitoxin system